jgi:hypothetical protein
VEIAVLAGSGWLSSLFRIWILTKSKVGKKRGGRLPIHNPNPVRQIKGYCTPLHCRVPTFCLSSPGPRILSSSRWWVPGHCPTQLQRALVWMGEREMACFLLACAAADANRACFLLPSEHLGAQILSREISHSFYPGWLAQNKTMALPDSNDSATNPSSFSPRSARWRQVSPQK